MIAKENVADPSHEPALHLLGEKNVDHRKTNDAMGMYLAKKRMRIHRVSERDGFRER